MAEEKVLIKNLKQALEIAGMTQAAAGVYAGIGKSAVSLVCSQTYPNWEAVERQIIRGMIQDGIFDESLYDLSLFSSKAKANVNWHLDPNCFITTGNVKAVDSLGEGLLDESSILNSSIGVVVGPAGFGKSEASRHFVINHERSAYVLYMEGFTLNLFIKRIASELTGTCAGNFERNLDIIRDATRIFRRLVVIDEADRIPLRYLEAVRNINEYCSLPIMLVGEETLIARMNSQDRLKSRIRKPLVQMHPLNVTDVATYYRMALGMDISKDIEVCKILLNLAQRDFRILVNDAQHIAQIMNTNGFGELTKEILNAYGRKRKA